MTAVSAMIFVFSISDHLEYTLGLGWLEGLLKRLWKRLWRFGETVAAVLPWLLKRWFGWQYL
jgi:hypothetical protein